MGIDVDTDPEGKKSSSEVIYTSFVADLPQLGWLFLVLTKELVPVPCSRCHQPGIFFQAVRAEIGETVRCTCGNCELEEIFSSDHYFQETTKVDIKPTQPEGQKSAVSQP
ncbi:MAG: hypothetical protein PHT40_04580 [Patescibacteria group bacterium]|nr:hypothetical protein [Patescibacteria group bacterium]